MLRLARNRLRNVRSLPRRMLHYWSRHFMPNWSLCKWGAISVILILWYQTNVVSVGNDCPIGKRITFLKPFYHIWKGTLLLTFIISLIYYTAFNDPNLEKNPQLEVPRPPCGALSRTLNSLTPAQERRVQDVLDTLSEVVRKKRIMTFQYFKDFDRVSIGGHSSFYCVHMPDQRFSKYTQIRICHFEEKTPLNTN